MLDTSGDAFQAGAQANKEEREFFFFFVHEDYAVDSLIKNHLQTMVTTLCTVSRRIY